MPSRQLVFDVNETLLDLSPLDSVFESLFGDAAARQRWFASLLHWSTVTTLSQRYLDFGQLAGHCLDQLAMAEGVALEDSERDRVFDTIAALPPHDDVPNALAQLRAAGFTLTALTNSAQGTVDAQFEASGLTPLFDHVLSVDHARQYKPHPAAYAVAAGTLGCSMGRLRLIAAHDWDVTGAMRAGAAGAFVDRDGLGLNGAGERPDIVGLDLSSVAERIIAIDGD